MGVCASYEISLQGVKELSVKGEVSSKTNVLAFTASWLSSVYTNGGTNRQSDKEIADRDASELRKNLSEASKRSDDMDHHTAHAPTDETAALNRQLGVQSTITQPSASKTGSKRPQWRVTQASGFHMNMRPAGGTTPATGLINHSHESTAAESTAFRSAHLTSSAIDRGYGLLIPPK